MYFDTFWDFFLFYFSLPRIASSTHTWSGTHQDSTNNTTSKIQTSLFNQFVQLKSLAKSSNFGYGKHMHKTI